MNPRSDSALRYPLDNALPPVGASLEVAPGVRWLRMPLPFVLDHINLWLLRDELAGHAVWTLVDCGVDTPATPALREKVFAHVLDGCPVLLVVVQHLSLNTIGNVSPTEHV